MPLDRTLQSNMALGHVGVGVNIGDFDTETSAEARACRRYFDHCRDVILEMMPWHFATIRVSLQELDFPSTDPYYGHWAKKYKYPDNCARANLIVNPASRTPATQGEKIPFRVVRNTDGSGGKVILTDQANACLEMNQKDMPVDTFSATFGEGHALYLATRISPQLRVNSKLASYVLQQWQIWQAEAISQDHEMGQEDPNPISSFQSIRG